MFYDIFGDSSDVFMTLCVQTTTSLIVFRTIYENRNLITWTLRFETVVIQIRCFFLSGLDKIEYLQEHENEDIYKKAYDIIETYFRDADEEQEDNMIAPDSTTGNFAFGATASAPANGFTL